MTFTKYKLSDKQIKQIARLCAQEQGSLAGAKAEASLMANQLETSDYRRRKYGSGATGLFNWIRNGGWFYRSAYYMDYGSASASSSCVISLSSRKFLKISLNSLMFSPSSLASCTYIINESFITVNKKF